MSDINELWTQVRRLVLHMAHKRLRATSGAGALLWTISHKPASWAS